MEADQITTQADLDAYVRDAMTNEQHPGNPAWKGGAAEWKAHLDPLYQKVYGDRQHVIGGEPLTVLHGSLPDDAKARGTQPQPSASSESAPDAAAQAEVEAALRQELGYEYEPVMTAARPVAGHLFEGQQGRAALEFLSERVVEYGPKAEALAMKFLADLSKLKGGTR